MPHHATIVTNSLRSTHTHTHARTHAHTHTYARTHTHTHARACTHTHTCTYAHACTRACTHLHAHTHTHRDVLTVTILRNQARVGHRLARAWFKNCCHDCSNMENTSYLKMMFMPINFKIHCNSNQVQQLFKVQCLTK